MIIGLVLSLHGIEMTGQDREFMGIFVECIIYTYMLCLGVVAVVVLR